MYKIKERQQYKTRINIDLRKRKEDKIAGPIGIDEREYNNNNNIVMAMEVRGIILY